MHSPVGDITVFEDQANIVALEWGWVAKQSQTTLLNRAVEQLVAYMNSELQHFDLPLAPHGTAYQKVVWQALLEIPFGATRTYRAMAARIGGSPRSVGQANGRNPIPIIIPCHRVVAESHIGGYSGGDGLSTKHWLLALENPQRSLFAARVTNGETK
jgi:methylated-DNA-[protein]-cysteine S-methyltransferase